MSFLTWNCLSWLIIFGMAFSSSINFGEKDFGTLDQFDYMLDLEGMPSMEPSEENNGTVEFIEDTGKSSDLLERESEEEAWIPDNLEKAIFGKDNRKTVKNTSQYPYSAIALMLVEGECGDCWNGTGFMVSSRCLLTAAHCLVCTKHGKWAKSIDFYFGYNNSRNYLYYYSGPWHAWAGDTFPNKYYRINSDYGVVKLYKDVGNITGWFGIKWNASTSEKKLEVAGYRYGILKYARGKVKVLGNNHLTYKIDTVQGNSGGPIFDSSYYAYGINIAESPKTNYGYRLNSIVERIYDKCK